MQRSDLLDCSELSREDAWDVYQEVLDVDDKESQRWLCRNDLFYLLTVACKRKDVDRDWLYARCGEVQAKPDGYLDLWSREHYKAVCVNEVVPTPTGWKKHGDLVSGDHVFGPDGKPCKIVAKTPVFHDAECFRVTLDDGYSVVVSAEHRWTVGLPDKSRINGTNKRKKWKAETLDTRDLKRHVDLAIKFPSRRYPVIPVASPVQYPDAELPLDPYVLGVWLGDGSCGGPRITSGLDDAKEMQANLVATGMKVRIRRHSNAVTLALGTGIHGKKGTSDVTNALRGLGVIKKKRIPESYLRSSETQRFALLQGLMDTDGSCAESCGQAIFCNANEGLAADTFELAQSLGLKPTLNKRSVLYRGARRPYWQVQFLGRMERPPFRLSRKIAMCSPFGNHGLRKVKKVEAVASSPVSCIQVDREDGLYLIGRNFVTTHNSTIITFAKSIQDILVDPEVTIGIFSHTRPIAKGFLEQIKREFEQNVYLKSLFPDVLYSEPARQSPKWSLDGGIIVKRKTNPSVSTVEAWGLVDGQPTGKHFRIRVYDDMVTLESVSTPDQIKKTTSAWELSQNLAADGGCWRGIGTRYHLNDSYQTIMDRGSAIQRKYTATDNGEMTGNPVIWSRETLDQKRRDMGPYTSACQLFQNPVADRAMSFKPEWVKSYEKLGDTSKWNKYLLVDPASAKKSTSDYTVLAVIGLAPDQNYYLIAGIRDRMNLTQRANKVFELYREHQPKAVGYERYGMQADVEHLKYIQEERNFRFTITELGGPMPKEDRIKRLIPPFEQGRFWIPHRLPFVDGDGKLQDFVASFLTDEFLAFPVCVHDDQLDCIARIMDPTLGAEFPKPKPKIVEDWTSGGTGGALGWMA